MKPEKRKWLSFVATKPPTISDLCTHFALNQPFNFPFMHMTDGYTEHGRTMTILSIERRNYPNPHIIKGVLNYDLNRPGEDAGDNPANMEVIAELWPYPALYIYPASKYVETKWALVDEIPHGTCFRVCPNGVADDTVSKFVKVDDDTIMHQETTRVLSLSDNNQRTISQGWEVEVLSC